MEIFSIEVSATGYIHPSRCQKRLALTGCGVCSFVYAIALLIDTQYNRCAPAVMAVLPGVVPHGYPHRKNNLKRRYSMTLVKRYSLILTSATLLVLSLHTLALAADKKEEAIVKYRQEVMKSQGAHMSAAAAIIMGKVEFKDQLPAHVAALEATTKDIVSLFPAGSDVGKTKALKSVWSKQEEFHKRAKDAEDMSAALAKAVAAGDSQSYGKHFKALADACKSCHKDFRKKEKQ
jgi:cytochrome c556